MPTQPDATYLLAEAIEAAKAGQRARAYNLLLDVVELDKRNELAWLWLSVVADKVEDQRICLENVLTINPANAQARQRLAILTTSGPTSDRATAKCAVASDEAQISSPASVTLTLWPVVAFWVGISLLFIGGGLASLFQFGRVLLRSRGGLQSLSSAQMAWLAVAAFFLVTGFTGLGLAWQLGQRRPEGYYGSLLLGLVLVLLGPGFGMLAKSPNYVAVVCMGLMPAAVVFLTLASISGFEATYDTSVA